MKTSKSPEDTKLTPSKKKLKQARLPFKIISEVSPKPDTPSRKRKLSTPDAESIPKVGKISKENDIVEDLVVISDEDSKDGKIAEKAEKLPNPYVRLVDTAFKKKLQKSKSSKKKKSKQIKENSSIGTGSDTADDKSDACEVMEVDEPAKQCNEVIGAIDSNKSTIQKETENTVNNPSSEISDIIVIGNLHNTSDVGKTETSENTQKTVNSNTEEEIEPTDPNGATDDDIEMIQNNITESPEPLGTDNTNPEIDELKTPITPKRSARNKAKQEENNNSKGSPSSLKLNESVTTPTTPKQSSSAVKLDESMNGSTPNNLTPKQAQKKLESAKKREEREKEKLDREKKRQQEKEERAKQRQEKEDQKKKEREEKEEAKRKEKEEKEEQRKKEKEEKEKLKELDKKLKEEKEEQKRKEREEKEEQRRKEKETREEERRKKQEALELEKQEQELKKKKTAEAFVSFFVPKQKTEKDQPIVGTVSNNMLTSFTLKSDMRLAPTTRKNLSADKANDLVRLIKEQSIKENELYLKSLKSGASKPLSSGKTWPREDKEDDDDVVLVEDELLPIDGASEILTCEPAEREKLRPKLLSFHENRRPPYWGTWRKKSSFVKPRKPFGQDEKQLDYEVDSDDDWEEEQEGESIDGSAAGSDDEQGPDEYEVDNEVFVPHGYLSDEEATMDEDDVLSLSPETQKARLKHLEDEFESEMKKPTEKLKPRLYGLLWENSEGGKPEKCVDAMWNYFGKLAMILNDPTPLLQPAQEPDEAEKKKIKKKKPVTTSADGEISQKVEKKKKPQEKEGKPQENKKNAQESKKNQPGINMFLTKIKSS